MDEEEGRASALGDVIDIVPLPFPALTRVVDFGQMCTGFGEWGRHGSGDRGDAAAGGGEEGRRRRGAGGGEEVGWWR